MPLKFYLDHHVPRSVAIGLRLRNVDLVTAYEDRSHELPDPELLDRATSLDRVLVTQDDDLVVEAAKRQKLGVHFTGVIYAHQQSVSIGQLVLDLAFIAEVGASEDVENQVTFLPL
jgi:uncharacterized protein with PIN domain